MTPVTVIQRYGYNETLSLTVREEYKLKVFENRVLRKIFLSKRDDVMEEGGDCTMESFITCTNRQVCLEYHIKNEIGGACGMCGQKASCIHCFGGKT